MGAYSSQITSARNCLMENDKIGYNTIKENLPAVTFCGTFAKGHKADECICYNNLLVIDIDKLSETQFNEIKKHLDEDPYIAAYWQSPSGHGFKGLVTLEYDKELLETDIKDKHKVAFQQLFTYLFSNYEISLDASGKDICRLCFMSIDESIRIKDESKSFFVKYEQEERSVKFKRKYFNTVIKSNTPKDNWNEIYGKATNYINNGENRALLTYIYKKLKKKGFSITDSWENWVKVAFAIASSVHPVKGREIFLDLCRLDGPNHDEVKSEHLIWDAYSKSIGKCSISTIIYLARQKGVMLDR